MRGVIVKWDDEKGYGFIRIDGGNKEIFCHISDFSPRNPRPEIDEAVGFEVVSDGKGRFSAKQIRYLNRERAVSPVYRKKHRKDEESPTSIVQVVLSLSVGLLLVSVIGYKAYQYASEKLTPKQENTPVKTQVLPEIKRQQPIPLRRQATLLTNDFVRRSQMVCKELFRYQDGRRWRRHSV